jgi:hypothetical protein
MAKPTKPAAPAPGAGETDPANLVNAGAAKSAVEVATEITEAAAEVAPAATNPLFVFKGLQYGGDYDAKKGIARIPVGSLCNGKPKAGDDFAVNPGDGYFQSRKIEKVSVADDELVIQLVEE